MNPIKTLLASCLAILTFTAVPASAQSAAQPASQSIIKIGWTTADSERDPYAIGARQFKSAVERDTRGAVQVQLYPNRQLGDERQMLEGMRFGTVDAGVITNAVIAQIEPSFQVNDMPFLFGNEKQAHKVLDGKVGDDLGKRLAAKGIVALGYMEGGFRQMINNKKPVATPADVQGVKYRVMQNPVFIDMFTSLGGSAVPMAWGETFTAVQQGTVDGLEIPIAVIQANKYFDVTKYLSLTNHTYSMIGLVMSKKALDKLSPEHRQAVLDAGRSATAVQRQVTGADTDLMIADLEKRGMKINKVTNVEAFRKSVGPVYEKFRASPSGPLLDQVLTQLK